MTLGRMPVVIDIGSERSITCKRGAMLTASGDSCCQSRRCASRSSLCTCLHMHAAQCQVTCTWIHTHAAQCHAWKAVVMLQSQANGWQNLGCHTLEQRIDRSKVKENAWPRPDWFMCCNHIITLKASQWRSQQKR